MCQSVTRAWDVWCVMGTVQVHWCSYTSGHDESLLLQHGLNRGVTPFELAVRLRRLDAVAAAVDPLAQACRGRRIKDVTALDEGVEGVGIENLRPQIDVVCRRVAGRREEVLEVRWPVAHDDALWHVEALQLLLLKLLNIERIDLHLRGARARVGAVAGKARRAKGESAVSEAGTVSVAMRRRPPPWRAHAAPGRQGHISCTRRSRSPG